MTTAITPESFKVKLQLHRPVNLQICGPECNFLKVWVDGELVPDDCYVVEDNILTFTDEFVKEKESNGKSINIQQTG